MYHLTRNRNLAQKHAVSPRRVEACASTRHQVWAVPVNFSTLKLLLVGLAASQRRSWQQHSHWDDVGWASRVRRLVRVGSTIQRLTTSDHLTAPKSNHGHCVERVGSSLIGGRPLYGYALLSGKRHGQVSSEMLQSWTSDASAPHHHHHSCKLSRHRVFSSHVCVQECFTELVVRQSGRPIDVNQRLSASMCSKCQVIPGHLVL